MYTIRPSERGFYNGRAGQQMNFLTEVCQRPDNERAYILIIAGYPADNATIPAHAMQKSRLAKLRAFFKFKKRAVLEHMR